MCEAGRHAWVKKESYPGGGREGGEPEGLIVILSPQCVWREGNSNALIYDMAVRVEGGGVGEKRKLPVIASSGEAYVGKPARKERSEENGKQATPQTVAWQLCVLFSLIIQWMKPPRETQRGSWREGNEKKETSLWYLPDNAQWGRENEEEKAQTDLTQGKLQ